MTNFRLDIVLLDGASFSRDASSTGDHRTLDRIPGANLWGLVCSRLYEAADSCADEVAHGGYLHFGDGYPLAPSGAVALPAPLSLHYDKTAVDGPWHQGGYCLERRLFNGLHHDLATLGQARAVRNGYLSLHGEWVEPQSDLEMSTAIEATAAGGARAAESTLHGQSSLRRRIAYRAEIVVCADAPELRARLQGAIVSQLGPLGGEREVQLGRGKGVHYGRARVCLSEVPSEPLPATPLDGLLTLWLLSDACLRDAQGLPTLQPDGTSLGLPERLAAQLQIDPARCFVRHRSHAAYNRHRQCHGLERQCLEAGSVLTYRLRGADDVVLRARLQQGIGTAPELGFGRIWVDPPLLALATGKPRFEPLPVQPLVAPDVGPASPEPLARSRNQALVGWAQATASAAIRLTQRATWIEAEVTALAQLLERSRRFMGADDALPHGPGRSQWGQVGQVVRDAQSRAKAQARLFDVAQGVLRPAEQPAAASPWHVETGDAEVPTPAHWWRARLDDAPGADWPAQQQALCMLAAAVREADPARPHAAQGGAAV